MRALLPILLTASISACSTFEPAPNPWADQERIPEQATYPIQYPELDESNLGVVLEAAAGNYEIAQANAEAIERIARAYNAALDAGEAEHEIAEQMRRMYEQERRARFYDKLQYAGIVIGALVLGIAR